MVKPFSLSIANGDNSHKGVSYVNLLTPSGSLKKSSLLKKKIVLYLTIILLYPVPFPTPGTLCAGNGERRRLARGEAAPRDLGHRGGGGGPCPAEGGVRGDSSALDKEVLCRRERDVVA